MSWGIDLDTDKDMTQELVDDICSQLPMWMRGLVGSKQEWGWSLAVDLRFSPPRRIALSGAGFSRDISNGFSEAFARRLEQRGFQVTIGAME